MLYDELSAEENLRYFAGLYHTCSCLTPSEALLAVGLDPTLTRPVGQFSQGMRQRASLARVLLPSPNCCSSTSRSPTWTLPARARWWLCWRSFAPRTER